MTNQLDRLADLYREAKARPNRPQAFIHDRGPAAAQARSFGAVTRVNRIGVGGAWCGYDYLNEEGRVVLRSMSGV